MAPPKPAKPAPGGPGGTIQTTLSFNGGPVVAQAVSTGKGRAVAKPKAPPRASGGSAYSRHFAQTCSVIDMTIRLTELGAFKSDEELARVDPDPRLQDMQDLIDKCELIKRIDRLEKEIAAEARDQAAFAKMVRMIEEPNQDFSGQNEQLRREKEELRRENDELRRDNDELHRNNDELHRKADKLLRNTLAGETDQFEQLQHQSNEAQETLHNRKRQHEIALERIQRLEEENSSATRQANDANARCEQAERDLADFEKESDRYADLIEADIEVIRGNFRGYVDRAEREIAELKEGIEVREWYRERIEKEVDALIERDKRIRGGGVVQKD